MRKADINSAQDMLSLFQGGQALLARYEQGMHTTKTIAPTVPHDEDPSEHQRHARCRRADERHQGCDRARGLIIHIPMNDVWLAGRTENSASQANHVVGMQYFY